MEEYSFTSWTETKAKRIRYCRRISNSIWVLAICILAMNLGHWTVPDSWWPVSIPFAIYLLSWFGVSAAFFYGAITCPSCDMRFTRKLLPPVWVPRRCQSCKLDIFTLHHETSNSRWSGRAINKVLVALLRRAAQLWR
jgi:hypothetical protein